MLVDTAAPRGGCPATGCRQKRLLPGMRQIPRRPHGPRRMDRAAATRARASRRLCNGLDAAPVCGQAAEHRQGPRACAAVMRAMPDAVVAARQGPRKQALVWLVCALCGQTRAALKGR